MRTMFLVAVLLASFCVIDTYVYDGYYTGDFWQKANRQGQLFRFEVERWRSELW
jgi:hypothetical protein